MILNIFFRRTSQIWDFKIRMDTALNLKSKKKTWLITGVAGFIGSNIASFLIKNNQRVIGVDNFITGSKKNLKEFSRNELKNFKFYEGDITNENFCDKVCKNVEIVLHFLQLL